MKITNEFNVQNRGRSSGQKFQESLIHPERIAERLKQNAEKLIEEITVRYLENFPQQSERDAAVLWRLAFAYEEKGE